jgi:putative peptide zinc metalloprotease protein
VQVYARAEGFVDKVFVAAGASVRAGTPLFRMRAPELAARIAGLEARVRELQTRGATERIVQRVASKVTDQELAMAQSELTASREEAASLHVASPADGPFVLADAHELQGRHFHKGQLIGYVVKPNNLIVRAVVPQNDIGLLRAGVTRVEVRLAEHLSRVHRVAIVHETPAATTVLPSRALGTAGGGRIAVRRDDPNGVTADERVFSIDLGLPAGADPTGIGERVYVRFEHGASPLALQGWRGMRQLFLSRLSV